MPRPLLPLLLLAVVLVPARLLAAESYANCTGFIDSVPATITSDGTWCVRRQLYTSQTSGAAITVLAENVTVNCNDFRLSGLGAGLATVAAGILSGRRNTTVRRCRIQGFSQGVALSGGGQLVEDNSFDFNTRCGVSAHGNRTAGLAWVRRNRINDTGHATVARADGILASHARVEDNVIAGVTAEEAAAGIRLGDGMVRRNRLSGVHGGAGILSANAAVLDNTLVATATHTYYPVKADYAIWVDEYDNVWDYWWANVCRGNVAQDFRGAIDHCLEHDNAVQP